MTIRSRDRARGSVASSTDESRARKRKCRPTFPTTRFTGRMCANDAFPPLSTIKRAPSFPADDPRTALRRIFYLFMLNDSPPRAGGAPSGLQVHGFKISFVSATHPAARTLRPLPLHIDMYGAMHRARGNAFHFLSEIRIKIKKFPEEGHGTAALFSSTSVRLPRSACSIIPLFVSDNGRSRTLRKIFNAAD